MATYSGISKVSFFHPSTGDFIQLNSLSSSSSFEHTLIEDEETTGAGYAGANYALEVIASDITPQMYELFQEWQELQVPLEIFGYGPDFFLQWLQKRTISIAPVNAANATEGRRKYRILVTFSGITSQIRWGANLLHLVQPWRESTTTPGQPQGWTFGPNVSNRNWDTPVFGCDFSPSSVSTAGFSISIHYPILADLSFSFNFVGVLNGIPRVRLANSSVVGFNTFTLTVGRKVIPIVRNNPAFIPLLSVGFTGENAGGNTVEAFQISNPAIRAGNNHRYIEE